MRDVVTPSTQQSKCLIVWLDLGLNLGLPDHWWTLNSFEQWTEMVLFNPYLAVCVCGSFIIKSFSETVNLIARLKIELFYFGSSSEDFTHYTMGDMSSQVSLKKYIYGLEHMNSCYCTKDYHQIRLSMLNKEDLKQFNCIQIICIKNVSSSSSSSSCHAISMDIPDPLSLQLPIFHCFRQVHRVTSRIGTELLYVGSSWASCLCSSMWRGPQEYITYELVPTSPAVSRMSGSSRMYTWIYNYSKWIIIISN